MRLSTLLLAVFTAILHVAFSTPCEAAAISIASDSMAASYSDSSQLRGWGQMIPGDFSSTTWQNEALSGSSTASFLNGSAMVDGVPGVHHWQIILDSHPAYVLISFGANDSGTTDDRYCTPQQYSANLSTMVEQALAIGAKPYLITPPCGRNFNADGTVNNSLRNYADAMIAVAEAENVPYFDLNAALVSEYQALGPQNAQSFGHSDNSADRLHFGAYGADYVANLIADNLAQGYPELKPFLVPEPSTPVLLAIGIMAWLTVRTRRSKVTGN